MADIRRWSLLALGVVAIAALVVIIVVTWQPPRPLPPRSAPLRAWGLSQPFTSTAVAEEGADLVLEEVADALRDGVVSDALVGMVRRLNPQSRSIAAALVMGALQRARSSAAGRPLAPGADNPLMRANGTYLVLQWGVVGTLRDGAGGRVLPLSAAHNPQRRNRYFYRVEEKDSVGNSALVGLDALMDGEAFEEDGSRRWLRHGQTVAWDGTTWAVILHRQFRPME